MNAKDPTSYSLLTYVWVVGLAAWGGVINYLRNLRNGKRRQFSVSELLGEMTTSGFAGVLSFWLLEHLGVDPLLEAAMVGIGGHMGSRTLFLIEEWARQRLHFEEPKE